LVAEAEKAARRLSRMGISCAVINARFVKPLDRETILYWARRGPYLVTVEDHNLTGGFGSAVLELLAGEGVRETQVIRMGYPDRFIEFGPMQKLRDLYGLNAEGIYRAVTGHLLPVADTASSR
jgi:1-deoxy-D-xylulose-5-phosphate synthase